MVILITGASHVGKTLLAQRMLEKYKYPCLSIDPCPLYRSGEPPLWKFYHNVIRLLLGLYRSRRKQIVCFAV